MVFVICVICVVAYFASGDYLAGLFAGDVYFKQVAWMAAVARNVLTLLTN